MAQDPRQQGASAPAEKPYTSSRDFTRKPRPDLPVLSRAYPAPQVMPANGRHYCVLCNLPHGLVCEVGDKRIKLKGAAHYLMPNKDRKNQGQLPQEAIFGATINYVDREFWDKFIEKMTDPKLYPDGYDPIVNGQIVWHQHTSEATIIRKESAGIKSGFEQAVPAEHNVQKDDAAASSSTVVKITE